MSEYNILLLSAGRRVELVQRFQSAARDLNIKSKIVTGDCSDTAPAMYFADQMVKLPSIHSEEYITAIINVCIQEDISLVVPTIDSDLLVLSLSKDFIEESTKAKVMVSDHEVVKICRDKMETQRFLAENHFGVPKYYSEEEIIKGDISFPAFIKPRYGSSSVNAFKVCTTNELKLYKDILDDPILQDYIEGEEFTVDVFTDFDGAIITIVPRLRMAIRGGEISKGKIIKDPEIIENIKTLVHVLKPIGHITVQLMKTTDGIKYIEINPRFGGGAPMSILSGADSCTNLFKLLMGQKIEYHENYRENLVYLRFDSCICLDENMEQIL
ncbi:ATP-grasp domain-containing protein [Halobacillus faecis]